MVKKKDWVMVKKKDWMIVLLLAVWMDCVTAKQRQLAILRLMAVDLAVRMDFVTAARMNLMMLLCLERNLAEKMDYWVMCKKKHRMGLDALSAGCLEMCSLKTQTFHLHCCKETYPSMHTNSG
jgi:hypothetical protein